MRVTGQLGQVRPGQVCHPAEVWDYEGQAKKNRSRANRTKLPKPKVKMSNELESDGGVFRVTEADGVGYYETETGSPSSTDPQ